MPFQPGDKIDRYTIAEHLGAGGMGDVYRASDERLQRTVALKVLKETGGTDSDPSDTSGVRRERMLREARAAASLDHPNVVAIFDVGEAQEPEDGRWTMYIAMELVKGRWLRDAVGDPSIPASTRLRWLTDIAKALGAAHKNGLVHRDIKPDNVMIRDDGAIKVLDFGIAKRARTTSATALTEVMSGTAENAPTLTQQGALVGTPFYMAPEQLRREPLDGRADQFSWGVVAYELLTGVRPWGPDPDAVHLVAAILSNDPAPPSTHDPSIPPYVDAIVLRALAKARDARFPSMEELAAALERRDAAYARTTANALAASSFALAVDSMTGGAKAGPVHDVGPPRAARRSWPLVGLGVVMLAGLALGVVLQVRGRAAAAHNPPIDSIARSADPPRLPPSGDPPIPSGRVDLASPASVQAPPLGSIASASASAGRAPAGSARPPIHSRPSGKPSAKPHPVENPPRL